MFRKNKGFTLVELLIVIAIIGILSTLVVTSTRKTRQKARDAARVSDINAFDTAVELYYEINGLPPTISAGTTDADINNWNEFETALADYIKGEVPNDPLGHQGDEFGYVFCSDGPNYILGAVFEADTTIRKDIDSASTAYTLATECIFSGGAGDNAASVVSAFDCEDGADGGITGAGGARTGSAFCLGYLDN